jgi:mono/diheme cytochrome c family protein
MSRRLLMLAGLALALAGCRSAEPPAEAPPPASTSAWHAPEEARRLANPVAATPESIKAGAGLYVGYCLLCHGERGRGDGPWVGQLPAAPADLTQPGLLDRQTDGEIFWKITKGREQMPGFEHQLKDEQRWHLVNYLRTLAKERR